MNNNALMPSPLYKVLLVGESTVGKSSIKTRFIDDTFPLDYKATVGIDYKIKSLKINGQNVKLSLWDTAGQERYRSLTKSYFTNANGIILCFDITNKSSFTELKYWIDIIQDYLGDKMVAALVGNKMDQKENRKVSFEEANNLAKGLGIKYFETSAMKDLNINDVFKHLSEKMLDSTIDYLKVDDRNNYNQLHFSLEEENTNTKVSGNSKCCF
jgi:Ras-related protein Rab-1A